MGVKVYGKDKIEEAARKILETGKEIWPTDENEVLFVSPNPDLLIPLSYIELEGQGFFIGLKKD